jgi:hypothetical protein
MKQTLLAFFLFSCTALPIKAQDKLHTNYRNFPLVVSLQFHALSMPFKDLKTNFSNVGIGLGTEIALGSTHDWSQQFNLIYYRNKNAGNGIGFYTQSSWRPTIAWHIYTEAKIGFGAMYSFRPVESYKQINGEWTSVGHRGKWMPVLPVGISLGYNKFSKNTYVAPFISYQLMIMGNYNKVLPAVPNTFIQIGSRIHFKN